MKDDKENKDDLIVEVDETQLSLPVEKPDEIVVETKPEAKPEEVKTEAEPKRERKRHNQDAIDALQAQLDAANRRAAEAEERARTRESELTTAKERVAQSDYDRVNGYLAAAKAKEDSIKRAIRSASEMGEHDKLADLQAELATVAARKLQYEDAKIDLEHKQSRAKEERDTRPVRTETQQPHDEFEARISGLSTKSQTWLRQHPECVTNPRMNAKLMSAHWEALGDGIVADSREYFERLEERMGFVESDDEDGDVEVETPRSESRRGVPAAPVSRDTRMGQVAPGKYRLTREEADMAEAMGMTPAQYAKNKVEMMKKGLWNQ